MKLAELKRRVCAANLDLVRRGLVVETWGNASGLDVERSLVVIKPSGVPYDGMRPTQMVVVALADGRVVEGDLRPSSDTPTHLALYRAFEGVTGVVHTHSTAATAWAQARREIPVLGTTHADYWHGPVPCTRRMRPAEIRSEYEAQTGAVIVERFRGLDPHARGAVLVADHGPFTWGRSVEEAVERAAVLEFVADLATRTLRLNPRPGTLTPALLDRHFLRKHGPKATYGQVRARGTSTV